MKIIETNVYIGKINYAYLIYLYAAYSHVFQPYIRKYDYSLYL